MDAYEVNSPRYASGKWKIVFDEDQNGGKLFSALEVRALPFLAYFSSPKLGTTAFQIAPRM